MTHAKTDCQGEDPIMILIERLRPVGDPINASEALRLEAAEAIASLQGEVERLKEALKPFADAFDAHAVSTGYAVQRRAVKAEDCLSARAALSQHPGEGEKA